MLERLFAYAIIAGARAVTGLRSLWIGTTPIPAQRIYYANHSSHGDFVLLWASLPPELRARTRPVAGMDYWGKGGLRGFIINRVFHGVLIERTRGAEGGNPLEPVEQALADGDSLILFPEARATSTRRCACCPSRAASITCPRRIRRSSWCRYGWTTSAA